MAPLVMGRKTQVRFTVGSGGLSLCHYVTTVSGGPPIPPNIEYRGFFLGDNGTGEYILRRC
jgi:hypothetical protein